MKLSRVVLAALLVFSQVPSASATQYFTMGAGWYELRHRDEASAIFNAEWRGDTFWHGLLPVAGAMVNTDGGAYGYGGFNYDWEFMPNWFLVPGLAVGAYSHGHSVELGGVVEFRDSIGMEYKFDGGDRAGLRFTHMSNASIYDHNPGVEMIMGVFSIPLN